MKKIIVSIFVTFFLLTGSRAFTQIYISFDGVEGESNAKGLKGAIEISSFSTGITNSAPAVKTGAGLIAGKASMSELVFTKQRGSSSAAIQAFAFNGKHTTKVELRFYKANNTTTPYLIITLEDVLVNGWKIDVDKSGNSVETISLLTAKIRFEDTVSNPDGTPKRIQPTGWDFTQNSAN